jgi:uncharacterized protein YfbU (UPF0304 family)
MKLTEPEKLILYNQYLILEKLFPEDEKTYKNAQTILSSGFTSEYDSLIEGFSDDYPEEICQETLDILQMFRSLYNSYYVLEDKSSIKINQVKFQGFDGNEEGKHYNLAKFYLKDEELFEEFKDVQINSHSNKLAKYRAMLLSWGKYSRYDILTREQIIEILEAIDLY